MTNTIFAPSTPHLHTTQERLPEGALPFLYTDHENERELCRVAVISARVDTTEHYTKPTLLMRALIIHSGVKREFAVSQIDWDCTYKIALLNIVELINNCRHTSYPTMSRIKAQIDCAFEDTPVRNLPAPAPRSSDDVTAALAHVETEIQEADQKWPAHNSAHEGLGVQLEEVRELEAHVFTKQSKRDLIAMRAAAIQIAACAVQFAISVGDAERGRK